MFKRSKSYQRRYNNIIGIDKVSNDVVESTGIDSYKPSKCNSITDTFIGSFGEDEIVTITQMIWIYYSLVVLLRMM